MIENLELVIFDLGGTTIRDSGQVPETFVSVLRSYGIEVSDQDVQQARGASKREVIRQFVKDRHPSANHDIEALTSQIFGAFRETLAKRYSNDGVEVLPRVIDTFNWLHRNQVKIAINTGFDRYITSLILQSVGWGKDIIHTLVCGDDVTQGRPAPYLIFRAMERLGIIDVHNVAVVGDTILDLQAGWNAGVRLNIGVWSGAHSRERLEHAPHTMLLPEVGALPDALSEIFKEE
jgi:phosphonatase-like hydrolase